MKSATRLASVWGLFAMAVVGCFSTFATPAEAQNPGNNAVYNSMNGVVPSLSFIDASVFIGNGSNQSSNICGAIYGILSGGFYNYPATGAVIDARGISGTTALTCATGKTPWTDGTTPVSLPSTILLPATGGASATPIIIATPWVIPSNTHLIGEGDGIGSSAATTIQVSSTFNTTPGYIMQFGSASGASGISVERLTIDGQGNSVDGIVNPNAGPNSYVDHVTLYQIRGAGLLVENNADGSGPYSNITFNTGSYGGTM